MPRLSGPRKKRYTGASAQTTHRGSRRSSWYEAINILAENDTHYLVQWAGKDPSTAREWDASWV